MKLFRVLAVFLCLTPLSLAAALAATPAESKKSVYIVQLAGDPLARSAAAGASAESRRKLDLESVESLRSLERLRGQEEETLDAVAGALGRDVEPLQRYSIAFHGVALDLTEKEAASVAKVPGVMRVQPSRRYHISSDVSPALTGAPGVWNGTTTGGLPGTKGEGMVIGVIDTGISLGHPSFADVGGDGYNHVNPRGSGNYVGWCSPSNPNYDPTLACNDKVIGVWSYLDSGSNPRDDNGHGTHTASIAAGNQVTASLAGTSLTRQISGVAPHANLISYDTCSSYGYCYDSTLIAAIDQAVADGVDVINFSISDYEGSPWSNSVDLALLGARDAGIFVASALDDDYQIGSPGRAPWVLAVGASSHSRRFVSSLVGVGGGATPPPTLQGTSLSNSYGPVSIVSAGDYGDYSCDSPFPAGTFGGKIVVCDTSYYDSEVQIGQNVLAGGAGGVVLADYYSYSPQQPGTSVLPFVRLPSTASYQLWNWLETGSGHTARIAGTTVDIDPSRADRLWIYSPDGSSYYESQDVLKPDVVAPGQDILAAHLSSGYKVLSGTSMAAAHASGAAALLMDLHPGWTPAEVQSALQMTGVAITRTDGTAPGPIEIGGGRLNLGSAARAGLVLDVTTAALEAANPATGGSPKDLNLAGLMENRCIVSCGWTRVVRSTLATTSTWTVSVESPAGVSLTVTPSSFTLGPGGTQSLQITASGSVTLSDWKYGSVTLNEIGAQAPPARLPMATFWVYHEQLTVQKAGVGSGRVTSNPPGIDCGSDCSELYPEDTHVTLTATPSPGSVFVGWDGYCYGTAPTCTVSMYSSQTVIAYFNPPSPDKALTNHVPIKDSLNGPVSGGTWNYYSVDLGSGNGELVVDLLDLNADAGLYVRFGSKPVDYEASNCVDDYSYGTNNRRCVITNPGAGRWWIGVNNQDESFTIRYSIVANWGSSSDRQLANRSPMSDFLSSPTPGSAWKYYFVDLPAGSTDLLVELSQLSADADLYVRFGSKPDRNNNDCASSEGSTLADHCAFTSPAAGRWWIGVNNFSAGTISYRLKASWQTVDVPTDFYTVSPCRVLDTRTAALPLVSGVSRSIQVAGLCGIPQTAKAVSVNITVIDSTGVGFLTLYPGNEGVPSTSSINFAAYQVRANNATLKLDGSGLGILGAAANIQGAGQVHLVVDVSGYYE